MKILLKEKLRELASSLETANQYFRTVADKNAVGGLFMLCQAAAEQMGDIIEGNESGPLPTLPYLEEYCELVYQLYASEISDWPKTLDCMEAAVSNIQSSVDRDISAEKGKVAFLPYSASMWDCFDSIYAEAKKDGRFDVKVIPIPYYSLDPDGQPREVHYEGEEIKKYAPVTSYEEYDFASERPDIILIHNPYDGYNRITQVFKEFFSSELVKYTDHLVYIPYFISRDRTMPNLLQMPGVQNAWRVFVQDGKIRQEYIDGGMEPEKVVALGSPKMDMVAKLAQGESPLPPEWSSLTGRRIFFYNTAVADIIDNKDCFLEKVQYVVNTFKKYPDMALLWRPHPLSVATMQSMAPELVDGYLKIVDEFKGSGLGVYDETGELERAIAISDGYVGNLASSVSCMYEMTQKPAFYVRYDDPSLEMEARWARGLGGEVLGQKIYLFSWEYNKIIVYDERTKAVTVESGSSSAAEQETFLYLGSLAANGAIYFLSSLSPAILKYGIFDGRKKIIGIGAGDNRCDCVFYEGKLYLLPVYFSEHVKVLDLGTEQVSLIETKYLQQFPNLGKTFPSPIFVGDTVIGNTVWRPCRYGSLFQVIDLEHNTIGYVEPTGIQEVLCAVAFDGQFLWGIALRGNRIYQWDPAEDSVARTLEAEEFADRPQDCIYSQIYCYRGGVWVFLRDEYKAFRIDSITGRMERLDFSSLAGPARKRKGGPLFSNQIRTSGGFIYLFPYHAHAVVKINARTREASLVPIPVDRLLDEFEGSVVHEGICTLDGFLQRVGHKGAAQQNLGRLSAGESIWNHMVQHLYS